MIKFKTGTQVPISDDGIIISDNKLGYDIDGVRFSKKNPDWQSFDILDIDLVIDGVRTAEWYSTLISSVDARICEITYDNHNCVQLMYRGFVCFRIDLSELSLIEMSYRVNTTGCGIYVNNTKDPTTSADPSVGAIASTPLDRDKWTTSTLDVSALNGFNNIYVTSPSGYSTYIASLRIH